MTCKKIYLALSTAFFPAARSNMSSSHLPPPPPPPPPPPSAPIQPELDPLLQGTIKIGDHYWQAPKMELWSNYNLNTVTLPWNSYNSS